MKTKKALRAIAILLAGVGLCAVLCQVTIYDCLLWDCAPARPFRVLALDLPSGLFPEGSIINSLYPLSEGEGTTENGSKSVYWDEGGSGALYEVLRYPSARKAAEIFSLEKRFFADPNSKQPWQRPSELIFVSPKADEFFLGCGYRREYRCGMVARYAEYVVHFNATIDSEMTHERFEKLAAFIDNQISDRLYP